MICAGDDHTLVLTAQPKTSIPPRPSRERKKNSNPIPNASQSSLCHHRAGRERDAEFWALLMCDSRDSKLLHGRCGREFLASPRGEAAPHCRCPPGGGASAFSTANSAVEASR